MKTQPKPFTIIILIVAIAAITIASHSDARETTINHIYDNYVEYMDDTSTVYESSVETNTLRLNNINMHVMKDFLYRFKGVNNEKWFAIDGGFIAKFTTGNIASSVTYKMNGEWLYTISNYDKNMMPEEISILVKQAYNSYDIVHINEIEVPNQDNPIFLIYIQSKTKIKILRICNGEMEILHDYIRG